MSIFKKLSSNIILLIIATFPAMSLNAQTPVDDLLKEEVINLITDQYTDWTALEMSGKLQYDALPVTPSVKIHMVKDCSMMISVRVPIKGEVFRMECDTTEILVVNKLNKTYTKADMSTLLKKSPATLGNLQDLFLGRVFIIGKGTLSESDAPEVNVYMDDSSDIQYAIIPQNNFQGFSYGFAADDEGQLQTSEFNLAKGVITAFVDYYSDKKGTDIQFTIDIASSGKSYTATLDMQSPEPSNEIYEPFVPNKKYKQVEPRDFIKSIFK